MATPANQVYTYHYNGIGSTIAMTDSSKNIVNKYAYSPFGRLIGEEGTISQPFKYAGRYGIMHEPNNLYYMRARYYDAEVGRFISEDPSGFDGGINLYAYCNNNPVNFVDPLGLEAGSAATNWTNFWDIGVGKSLLSLGQTEWASSPGGQSFVFVLAISYAQGNINMGNANGARAYFSPSDARIVVNAGTDAAHIPGRLAHE